MSELDRQQLCEACLLAKELWAGVQALDSTILEWEEAGDLCHRHAVAGAADRLGIDQQLWRQVLERQRQSGESMLQLCVRMRDQTA